MAAAYRTQAVGTTNTGGSSPTQATTLTTLAGDQIIVTVHAVASTSVAGQNISDSDGGTWSVVKSFDPVATKQHMETWIRDQLIVTGSSFTVTTGFNQTGGSFAMVTEAIAISGVNVPGSSAIVQSINASGNASTTPAATFASSANTNNVTLGFVSGQSSAGVTEPSGAAWTERADTGVTSGVNTAGIEGITRDSGFTGTTITWGATVSNKWGAIIVELQAGAAAAALAATPAAVSTITAALTTSILLAASASSASTATAALTNGIRLNAAPAASSTATAALTTSIRLAATPSSVSTITAALTTASGFAATAGAQSTITAALTTSIRLNATPSAVSTATAALGTSIKLAATPTSVSTTTASLTTAIRLNATLAAASATTAALTTRIQLNAAVTAQSTATARLYVYDPSMMLALFG